MGRLIAAADAIQRAINGFVLFLHHPIKRGDLERGSGALRGAACTMMRLVKSNTDLTLTCSKQNHAPEFEPIWLELKTVDLDGDGSSCVIAASNLGAFVDDSLSPTYEQAVLALSQTDRSLVLGLWRQATNRLVHKAISERNFQRIANDLLKRGFVSQAKERGPYGLTTKGTATANQLPTNGQGSSETTAATPAPLLRGQWQAVSVMSRCRQDEISRLAAGSAHDSDPTLPAHRRLTVAGPSVHRRLMIPAEPTF